MRLGIDASNLRVGGGVTHLVEVLRSSQPMAYGIDAVTVWGGRRTLARLPADRPWLRLQHEPMLDGPLPIRLYWHRARLSSLARIACDLLFVPGGMYGGTFEPFVTMSRNMLPFEPTEARRYGPSWTLAKLRILRSQQTSAFRRADGVIFLNDYARTTVMQVVERIGGATAVIPHGVGDRFRRSPRPSRPMTACSEGDPLRLLYVSRIDMYKHQWRVVEAAAALRRRGLPVELTLVGSAYPPAHRRLREAIRRHDPHLSFVHYRGEVPYTQLPEVYHRAEVFIFASSCENMPNVLLEAMAAGLPIACARRGPMPEILGEGGAYFDPEDAVSIREALTPLVQDASFRHRTACAAYDRAQAYTWNRCAAETLEFLVKTASGRGAAANGGDRRAS